MRQKINKYTLSLLFVFALVAQSCERKELYYSPLSKLQLKIHWPENIQEKPLYNEVVFYPTGGGNIYNHYLNSDSEEIQLAPGEYNVIFYNWRTNANAQTSQFRDENSYLTMMAFTGKLFNKSDYFENEDIYLSPDMLYSWSTEDYMPTRVISTKAPEEATTILNIYPVSVVHQYDFHVEVVGLQYVMAVSAVSLGFAPQLTMYNKQGAVNDAGHKLNIKVTETGFQCSFSAYNHHKLNNQRLYFVIKLPDGSIQEEYRDIKSELDEKGVITYVEKIVIDYDGPIPPPPVGGGFDPPEIGDWVDNEEEVIFPKSRNQYLLK